MKKKTLSSEKKKAWDLMSKYVRLKASDDNGMCKCVTCGNVKHWKEMQAGHYISRTHLATFLLEENIHVQCVACNMFGKGQLQEYALYIIDMYGVEKLKELRELKNTTIKRTIQDYEDFIFDLKPLVTNLMLEKC